MHGLIQITGYYNHKACGKALGVDLVHNPRLLTEPDYAARSAAWFWKEHGLNELADRGMSSQKQITKKINGGLNGINDRLAFYNKACETLDVKIT